MSNKSDILHNQLHIGLTVIYNNSKMFKMDNRATFIAMLFSLIPISAEFVAIIDDVISADKFELFNKSAIVYTKVDVLNCLLAYQSMIIDKISPEKFELSSLIYS